VFFSIDLCRVGTAIDSTLPLPLRNKNTLFYSSLPVLKNGPVFVDYLKCHFSISFYEEMVRRFDFLFIRRPFLGVRHSKNRILKFLV